MQEAASFYYKMRVISYSFFLGKEDKWRQSGDEVMSLFGPKISVERSLEQTIIFHVYITSQIRERIKDGDKFLLTLRLPLILPSRELTLTIRAPEAEGFINGTIALITFLVPK